MTATRASRIGIALTLALAAWLGMPGLARAQVNRSDTKAKGAKPATKAARLVDLNSATSAQLQALPGVSEPVARKIIDRRPHKAVADLAAAGVPAGTIDGIKPLVEVKPLPAPVDVNADPVEKLETLPGIGQVLAKEIVAARPVADYPALGKLKGFGPDKIDGLMGRLKFGEGSPAAKGKAKVEEAKDEEASARATAGNATGPAAAKAKADEEKAKGKVAGARAEEKAAPKAPKLAPGTKVNINTASKDVLDELPGIGPVKAQAILDARASKKFEKIEDIMTVKGIKDAEFAKIKDVITVK